METGDVKTGVERYKKLEIEDIKLTKGTITTMVFITANTECLVQCKGEKERRQEKRASSPEFKKMIRKYHCFHLKSTGKPRTLDHPSYIKVEADQIVIGQRGHSTVADSRERERKVW
ncbi:hypothetical protein CBL_03942 [Carabus blaptoides fortunei]